MGKVTSLLLFAGLCLFACDDTTAELGSLGGASGGGPFILPRDMATAVETDLEVPRDALLPLNDANLVDAQIPDDPDSMLTIDAETAESDTNPGNADAEMNEADAESLNNDAMVDEDSVVVRTIEACTTLEECAGNCEGDADCIQRCRDTTDEEVIAVWLTLTACLERKLCLDDESEINIECAARGCRVEFVDCFGETALPDETDEIEGCQLLAACDAACEGDVACRTDCLEAADDGARLLYADHMRCLMTNGEGNCDSTYEACFGTAPQLNCDELFECIGDCPRGNATCAPDCISRASDEAMMQSEAYETCLESSICGAQDFACRLADCETEARTCFDSVALPAGILTCSEFSDCLAVCPSDDSNCIESCETSASPDGYNQFLTFINCSDRNNCPQIDDPNAYLECVETNCASETSTCFGDTIGQGMLSCEAMYECINDCPTNDAACLSNCVQNVSPEGLAAAQAYESCFANSNCAEGDYSCNLSACSNEVIGCFGSVGVPSGTETCNQLNDCLGICADDDIPCEEACIRLSAPSEYNDFVTVSLCAQDSGCNGNSACINSACADEIAICLGEEPADSGLLDCDGFNDCLGDCGTDLFCQLECQIAASGVALADHQAVLDCADLFFCDYSDTTCLETNCMSQLEVCFGAIVRPSGVGTCQQLYSCLELCPEGTNPCRDQCITNTSPTSYDSAVRYSDCITDNCPNRDALCVAQNCSTEQLDCLAN